MPKRRMRRAAPNKSENVFRVIVYNHRLYRTWRTFRVATPQSLCSLLNFRQHRVKIASQFRFRYMYLSHY